MSSVGIISLEKVLLELTENADWRQVLTLPSSYPLKELSKYLWAWPNEEDLKLFGKVLKDLDVRSILSVGCGSGLLEWVIHNALGELWYSQFFVFSIVTQFFPQSAKEYQ